MSTVAEVISRTYREWLYPSSDRPLQCKLSAAISSTSALTFTYDASMLSADEEEAIRPGATVEIDSELFQVESVNYTTNTVTVPFRGAQGTAAATHLINASVTVEPAYPRKVVFDAVCDQVVILWPDFYKRVKGHSITSATTPVEVPAAVTEIERFIYSDSGTYRVGGVELLEDYPPVASGKAVQFIGVTSGKAGYLTYRSQFDLPSAESTDLVATTGLNAAWEVLLVIGAAAALVGMKEPDSSTQAFISEQLQREGFPVNSPSRQQTAMLRYYDFLRRRLVIQYQSQHRTTILRKGVASSGLGRR